MKFPKIVSFTSYAIGLTAAAISLFLFIPTASAQRTLTLQDAIDLALEKSYSMKSLNLTMVQAEQNLIAAKNSFKTNVSMSFDFPKWSESVSAIQVPNALPIYNNTGSMAYRGGLTVKQPLPTDGSISLTSTFKQNKSTTYLAESDKNLKSSEFLSSITLEFTQPLFSINNIKLDLKNAELNYENASRSKVRRQLDIIYNVSESFYNLCQFARNFEISRDDVEQQTNTTTTAKQKFDAGLIAEVQYLQMEVDLAEAKDQLVSAEASLKRQKDAFIQLIGLDAKDDISVQTNFEYTHFDIDQDKAIREGLANRSELREREIAIEQQKISIKEIDAQNAIHGDLSAFYDFTGLSDTDLSYNTGSYDLFESSWSDLRRRPRNRGVSFTLTVPVWDWGVNKARVNRAMAVLKDQQLSLDELKKTVERNIIDVVIKVRDAENRIVISKRRQELAQKTFDISLQRFNIGEITADQLALDRTRLNNAKMAYLTAYMNYQLAVADLKRNTLYDFATNQPIK